MDEQKIIQDCILTTDDVIFLLREWKSLLERGRSAGCVEATDYSAIRQQLQEAGLWPWAREAAGHGEAALQAVMGRQE
jgi:hypothetical protein